MSRLSNWSSRDERDSCPEPYDAGYNAYPLTEVGCPFHNLGP